MSDTANSGAELLPPQPARTNAKSEMKGRKNVEGMSWLEVSKWSSDLMGKHTFEMRFEMDDSIFAPYSEYYVLSFFVSNRIDQQSNSNLLFNCHGQVLSYNFLISEIKLKTDFVTCSDFFIEI